MKQATSVRANKPGRSALERIPTGITAFDHVLGGGFVSGSTILIAGPAGIGKTILCLQAAAKAAKASGRTAMIASGEQSDDDLAMIAARIGCKGVGIMGSVTGSDVYKVVKEAEKGAGVLVVDSIHTAHIFDVKADVGSMRQIEAVANYLTSFGRATGTVVLVVGHSNKDGGVAGPQSLQHLVDAVVWLDFVDQNHDSDRVLAVRKNRLGPSGVTARIRFGRGGFVDSPQRPKKERR